MADNDVIEIPIEIRTQDLKEFRELKRDIEETEKKANKIKDTTSRQATPTLDMEQRGGIFGTSREGETLPEKSRDKTSKQPIQRENEFKKVKSGLEELQDKVGEQEEIFSQFLGGLPTSGSAGLGGLMKFAIRFVPFIGAALLAHGFVEMIMEELLRDGGFFDRRLRIRIKDQFLKLTKRKESAEFGRGIKTLRVTSSPALRGPTTQVFSTQDAVRRGIQIVDENQESLAKGVLT